MSFRPLLRTFRCSRAMKRQFLLLLVLLIASTSLVVLLTGYYWLPPKNGDGALARLHAPFAVCDCGSLIRRVIFGNVHNNSTGIKTTTTEFRDAGSLLEEIQLRVMSENQRLTLTSTSVDDFFSSGLSDRQRPVVLLHQSGHLHLIIHAVNDSKDFSLQCVHGDGKPFLIKRPDLSRYRSVWCVPVSEDWPPPAPYAIGGKGLVEISKCFHSFGTTEPNDLYTVEVQFRNAGEKPLTIGRHPGTSCGCTESVYVGPPAIHPGEVGILQASVKTSYATSIREQVLPEIREVGTDNSIRIPILLCSVQPAALTISPSRLDFGKLINGMNKTRHIYLRETNDDRFMIDESAIKVGKLPIKISISQRFFERDLREYQLTCRLKPQNVAPGIHDGEIKVTTDSSIRPLVKIPVSFETTAPVTVTPTSLAFGVVRLGERQARETRINVGESRRGLSISIVRSPDNCKSIVQNVEGMISIRLVAEFLSSGEWNDELVVNLTNDVGSKLLKIPCSAHVLVE